MLKAIKKFINNWHADEYEVLTDTGWEGIQYLHETIPYTRYNLSTENYYLEAADTHILFNENMEEVYLCDLKINDKIYTKDGLESVTKLEKTSIKENMFDLELNENSNRRYYTNGILSHNTTSYCIFSTHMASFNEDKKILILANKGTTAIEIMGRIALAFELLPKWLKPGIVTWNKGSMKFSNGCEIFAASTSSDAARGFSANCVTGDTMITLEDVDKMIYEVPISHLENIFKDMKLKVLDNSGHFQEFLGLRKSTTEELMKITTGSGKKLKCTLEHILFSKGEEVIAGDLKINDYIETKDGLEQVKDILRIKGNESVYDLIDVQNDDHSYLTNNIKSHNCLIIDECVVGNTEIMIKNKISNEIRTVTMQDLILDEYK